MASLGLASVFSYEIMPQPFNSVALGGGAGVLAAVAVARAKRTKPQKVELIGDLPAIPKDASRTSSKGPRSPKSVEKERALKRYDRAFAQLLSGTDDASKAATLEQMRLILYELSPDLKAWSGDARLRVYLLLKHIRAGLDDPSRQKTSLELLLLILSKGGASAVGVAKPLFYEKIKDLYRTHDRRTQRFLPRIMLLLDEYDSTEVKAVAQEAIHEWDDGRFNESCGYLGFEELKGRGLRTSMREMLGAEIARAGIDGDYSALDRAVELYHEAK